MEECLLGDGIEFPSDIRLKYSSGRDEIAGRGSFEILENVTSLKAGQSANFGCDAAAQCSVDGVRFVVVADGVGKKKYTDVVSRIAVIMAVNAFKRSPQIALSKYYDLLLMSIQNFLHHVFLMGATTIVMARIGGGLVEVVSVGDSSAILKMNNGGVFSTTRGEHSPNHPHCLSGHGPVEEEHIFYYSVSESQVSTVTLCTDGVTDNLFVTDIVEASSAEEIAARAVSVFTRKLAPTPYKDGSKGKPDDVTVARIKV